jgi:hypothetical protein
MKRTTIFVPEPLERDLQLHARRAGKPVAWVVREALASYLASHRRTAALPSFTGVGESGRSDVSERHEETLWTEPHRSSPGRPRAVRAEAPARRGRRRS